MDAATPLPRHADGRPLDIVVAHDYLSQRGGGERVAMEIARALQPSQFFTALYAEEGTFPEARAFALKTSFLNRLPLFRRDVRTALPFLAFAWSARKAVDADVAVCSSSGWAHGLRTTPRTVKIVYCHNPARWLYQPDDYLMDRPWPIRAALAVLRPFLMRWDRRAAASATHYLCNSTSVAARIRTVYGREATVIFPPSGIETEGPRDPVDGIEPGYYLMVGRSRGYKGAQPLIDAFRDMSDERLVIAGGDQIDDTPPNVMPAGFVTDAQLRWLYANARALISVSREDFGMTPVEANAFGTPVLLLRAGGFLDSTDEGVSGKFIDSATPEAIKTAVRAFPKDWDKAAILRHADRFSAARFRDTIRRAVAERMKDRTSPAATKAD